MWHTTCKVQIDDIPYAGPMIFPIGSIGGWPPAREYHTMERQAYNVTGGGAVGVPAQQV